MATYKVTLSTVISYTATVTADDEDQATEIADHRAKKFGSYHHNTPYAKDWVDVNNEWQYEDPQIEEVKN
jgi:hypothetical protein